MFGDDRQLKEFGLEKDVVLCLRVLLVNQMML